MSEHAEQIIGLYRRHAAAWARLRSVRFTERAWIDRFASLMPERGTVLDIGCGSGVPIARHLAGMGCTVTGVDAAPELVDVARENMPDATWIVSDMRRMKLDRQFDGILAWNSMFHLTPADQRNMFPAFQRHAAPGAVMMFTSGTHEGSAIGTFEGEPLYHGSLDPQAYQVLLEDNGFEVLDHVIEDPECGGQTIWLAKYREEIDIKKPA